MKEKDYAVIFFILIIVFILTLVLIVGDNTREKCIKSNNTYISFSEYRNYFEYCGDMKDITEPLKDILIQIGDKKELGGEK